MLYKGSLFRCGEVYSSAKGLDLHVPLQGAMRICACADSTFIHFFSVVIRDTGIQSMMV